MEFRGRQQLILTEQINTFNYLGGGRIKMKKLFQTATKILTDHRKHQ
jgi:hypothetical protein